MEQRPFGNTGQRLSIIGFGGIVVMNQEQSDANRMVSEAIDRGVNYFDVAPSYADAEDRLGPALESYRDGIFLACKTEDRTREGAAKALRDSLKRLRTDHVDLYQLHALGDVEDARAALGEDGAIAAFVEAREQGLTRYLGFSAHSVDAALEAMKQFRFDSVLFPVNYGSFYGSGFGPQVIRDAKDRGVARLALKAMARRRWPEGAERTAPNCWYEPFTDPSDAELALRWALTQPITAAIPPGDPAMFRMAMDIAERFRPLTPEEMDMVAARAIQEAPIFPIAA